MMFFDQAHAASVICAQTTYKGLVAGSEAFLWEETDTDQPVPRVVLKVDDFARIRRARADRRVILATPIAEVGPETAFRVGDLTYKMCEGSIVPTDLIRFVYGQLSALCRSRSIRRVIRPYGHHLWRVTTNAGDRLKHVVAKGGVDFLAHPIKDLDVLGYAFKNFESHVFIDDFYQMTDFAHEYERVRDRLRNVICSPNEFEVDAVDVFVGYTFDAGVLIIDTIGLDLQSISVLPESLFVEAMPSWIKLLVESIVKDLDWRATFQVYIPASSMHESQFKRFIHHAAGGRIVLDCTSESAVTEMYGCRVACTRSDKYFDLTDMCVEEHPRPLAPLWEEKGGLPTLNDQKKQVKRKKKKATTTQSEASPWNGSVTPVAADSDNDTEKESYQTVLDALLAVEDGGEVVKELLRCLPESQTMPFLRMDASPVKTIESKLPMPVCMYLRTALPKTTVEQFLCQTASREESPDATEP